TEVPKPVVQENKPVEEPKKETPVAAEKKEEKKPEETPRPVPVSIPKPEVKRSESEMKQEVWKAMGETSSREDNLRNIQERLKEILGDTAPAAEKKEEVKKPEEKITVQETPVHEAKAPTEEPPVHEEKDKTEEVVVHGSETPQLEEVKPIIEAQEEQ